jgi:hypothetical protein
VFLKTAYFAGFQAELPLIALDIIFRIQNLVEYHFTEAKDEYHWADFPNCAPPYFTGYQ